MSDKEYELFLFCMAIFVQMEKRMNPLRPYERHDTLKQFLERDRDVLRFYCFWDNTGIMFGKL